MAAIAGSVVSLALRGKLRGARLKFRFDVDWMFLASSGSYVIKISGSIYPDSSQRLKDGLCEYPCRRYDISLFLALVIVSGDPVYRSLISNGCFQSS